MIFAFLIPAQAAHSTEEYVNRLYEVLTPARFVSSLFSSNLSVGFLVANVVLVGFGLWCWAVPVRLDRAARGLIWFWALLEASNGISHLILAAGRGGYFPGAATEPLLLLFSGWLLILQSRRNG